MICSQTVRACLRTPGSISERVIRARLARPQPEGVPGRHVEGENAASRDAGAREPDRGSQTLSYRPLGTGLRSRGEIGRLIRPRERARVLADVDVARDAVVRLCEV